MSGSFQAAPIPQFIIVPFTGLQICRRIPLQHINALPGNDEKIKLFENARQYSEKNKLSNPLTAIVSAHVACDHDGIESTGWIALNQNDRVFFRLIKVGGNTIAADLVIDTQTGPGRTPLNKVICAIEAGNIFRRTTYQFASIYTELNSKPTNILGSLVMDFGNSGTSCIFAPDNFKASDVRPILLHNALDPKDGNPFVRTNADKTIIKSSAFLLTVPDSSHVSPWVVLGKRAEELIGQSNPLVTSFYAPKKYVRYWPENLKDFEPTVPFTGLLGQRTGLVPAIHFVGHALDSILQTVVSSLTNPKFSSITPDYYPQVGKILLTYPLTWRSEDKDCFKEIIRNIADKLFVLPDKIKDNFRIEFVCSEPVAVAAYAIWESFLNYYHMAPNGILLEAPSLASSQLGNLKATQELRMLIVDIGGGSSDIALVHAEWVVNKSDDTQDGSVNVSFHLEESLRFNRAGDRISHIIATSIWLYISDKYKIQENLDFKSPSTNHAFTLQMKRQAVSKISELVENAKRTLSSPSLDLVNSNSEWTLNVDDENELCGYISPILTQTDQKPSATLSINLACLQKWIEGDVGSAKTSGEPGLMDIFQYIHELGQTLKSSDRFPHLIILSGRTTRLPFFKQLVAKHLGTPIHRVRSLSDMIPDALKGPDHDNMDKLAVVYGAHRFKHGAPINFRYRKSSTDNLFHRFIGTVSNTPKGFQLNRTLVKPDEPAPRTFKMKVSSNSSVLIGHAFRQDGRVEILAKITNSNSHDGEIEFDILDDYHVEKKPLPNSEGISIDEWVPGGTTNIVDNFNDTGRIDCEPSGFISSFIIKNRAEWLR